MIDSYSFGSITIDNKKYNHDVMVHEDEVIEWWREEGHNVCIADLKDLPKDIEIFVIGNGASGVCKIPMETREYIKEKGIEVIVENTGKAVKTFNDLLTQGKKVAGGFHLTC